MAFRVSSITAHSIAFVFDNVSLSSLGMRNLKKRTPLRHNVCEGIAYPGLAEKMETL